MTLYNGLTLIRFQLTLSFLGMPQVGLTCCLFNIFIALSKANFTSALGQLSSQGRVLSKLVGKNARLSEFTRVVVTEHYMND